jgi:hypothetical protein
LRVIDMTPPKVKSVKPANGAKGVSPGTNVIAAFSEPMAASSLSTTTFTLRKQGANASV